MPGDNAGEMDTRLTVIEVQHGTSNWGDWTQLEVWYWFKGDAHPRRFRVFLIGRIDFRTGDLIARDPHNALAVRWWDHEEHRRAAKLQLMGEVEELPVLA